ncbi:uncharacterized protein [Musca autumnalis]|uniref:uncharacterized protein n=1 Tax=Musca autumnalis TaxID=221902 RepID=UPI003CF28FA7
MASQQELFPEVVLSDFDEEMMSDREVEAELRAAIPDIQMPIAVATADIAPTTSVSNVDAKSAAPSTHAVDNRPVGSKTTTPTVHGSQMSKATFAKPPIPCRLCSHAHPIYKCPTFKKMSIEKRLKAVAYHHYCYNCLRPDHVSRNCPVPFRCSFCKNKHHSMLHLSKKAKTQYPSRAEPKPSTSVVPRGIFPVPPPNVLPSSVLPVGRIIMLTPTVVVRLCMPKNSMPVRAILDPCCQVSQVCASLIAELNWPLTKIDNMDHADFLIMSRFDSTQKQFVTARVANITRGVTPSMSAPPSIRESFVGLELADPTFDRSGPIAMVLGPEIYSKIISPRIITQPGLPTAQYTTFGWVISGPAHL